MASLLFRCSYPLGEMMSSWSNYNYCFNNPINYTDPTGMVPANDKKKVEPKKSTGPNDAVQMGEVTVTGTGGSGGAESKPIKPLDNGTPAPESSDGGSSDGGEVDGYQYAQLQMSSHLKDSKGKTVGFSTYGVTFERKKGIWVPNMEHKPVHRGQKSQGGIDQIMTTIVMNNNVLVKGKLVNYAFHIQVYLGAVSYSKNSSSNINGKVNVKGKVTDKIEVAVEVYGGKQWGSNITVSGSTTDFPALFRCSSLGVYLQKHQVPSREENINLNGQIYTVEYFTNVVYTNDIQPSQGKIIQENIFLKNQLTGQTENIIIKFIQSEDISQPSMTIDFDEVFPEEKYNFQAGYSELTLPNITK